MNSNSHGINKRLLQFAVGILTLFRIWLAVRTPLYLQADAGYDDYLLIRYAMNMIQGKWLGTFDSVTLAKTVSFPGILITNYLIGIPYSLGLICTYVLAIALLVYAVNKFISNYYFAGFTYLFLLFSPVMFHEENVQKVYRGGYIVAFSLLVIAAYIGIISEVGNEKNNITACWSALGTFALPVFWFLKEDSIWLLPFILLCVVYLAIAIVLSNYALKKKLVKILLIFLPICSLMLCTKVYKKINYSYYGVYTITDRSGSNFAEMISDLIKIDDPNSDISWITREMIDKAAECSPTLDSIMPMLTERINGWYGEREPEGDIIIWIIREAVNNAGIYDNGSMAVEEFYGNIDRELKKAFEEGALIPNKNRFYLSSVSRGYTPEEFWSYFSGRIQEVWETLVSYKKNETTTFSAKGDYEKIAIMAQLTNSQFIWKDTNSYLDELASKVVGLEVSIVKGYQLSGKVIWIVGVVGIIALVIQTIITAIKQGGFEKIRLAFIVIALGATYVALIVGVMWFCNFLSIRKVYDYLCGAIPIMNLLEAIGIYQLFNMLYPLCCRLVRHDMTLSS